MKPNQYKDARVIASFEPSTGSKFGRVPKASSNKSIGFSPFFEVSKDNG
jgi:hypothetical protein